MTVLAVLLIVTNLFTLVAIVVLRRRRDATPVATIRDAELDAAVAATARSVVPSQVGRARRVISVEILNPIELAGSRNRVFGIAGSFVPDLTRRIVYDQTVKIMRKLLDEHHVVADVRVHTLTPSRPVDVVAAPPPPLASGPFDAASPVGYLEADELS